MFPSRAAAELHLSSAIFSRMRRQLAAVLRKPLQKLRRLSHRLDRTPNLLFHSPDAAFAKAIRPPPAPAWKVMKSGVLEARCDRADGITVHRDVTAWTLKPGKEKPFAGGLIAHGDSCLLEQAVHWRNGSLVQEPPDCCPDELYRRDIPRIDHPVLFGGILLDHFGHFLVEGLARLWAYDVNRKLSPYIGFYAPWGVPDYLNRENFVNQVLTGFGFPHEKLIFIKTIVKLREVLVPEQKYGFGFQRNPGPVFLDFVKRFQFASDVPKGFENAERVYVSRSKLPFSHGRLVAERLFEEFLTTNGYKVFYPEEHSLFQQLTVYSKAKKLIFPSGSALHACVLLPDLKADVALLSRCKGIGLWQLEFFQGYGKAALGIDAITGEYVFGRDYWNVLAEIDYYSVSVSLKREGFLEREWEGFKQLNHSNLARYELQDYLPAIANDTRFLDFMMRFRTNA